MSASAPEAPIWVEINGRRRVCWTCTPSAPRTLVIGMLCGSGYITSVDELLAYELHDEPAGCVGVTVRVPEEHAARVALERRRMREHGCGPLHHVVCEPGGLLRERTQELPEATSLRPAFRALFASTDEAYPEGGMHAAALWLGDGRIEPVFDVGRHNAVDRALGLALERRLDRGTVGVLTSSRVSGAIALHAARAGIAFIASRSIPTTLARQVAEAAALPILARAGRERDE